MKVKSLERNESSTIVDVCSFWILINSEVHRISLVVSEMHIVKGQSQFLLEPDQFLTISQMKGTVTVRKLLLHFLSFSLNDPVLLD
jgi:hypothetical protein